MTLKLLVKKLHLDKRRFITSKDLKESCRKLNIDYYTAIRYLLSNKHLIRVLRGVFYRMSVEEREFNRIDISYMEAVAEALKLKNVKNWYFGLETAVKLNSLTHEYFATDYIINDSLFRPRAIGIIGHNIRFIKLKKSLFGFGIVKRGKINFSEIEKTVLDFIYLSKYRGHSNKEIKNRISGLIKHCSKNKLVRYSKEYNKTVRRFAKELA